MLLALWSLSANFTLKSFLHLLLYLLPSMINYWILVRLALMSVLIMYVSITSIFISDTTQNQTAFHW